MDDEEGVLASHVPVKPLRAAGVMRGKDNVSSGSARHAMPNTVFVRSP